VSGAIQMVNLSLATAVLTNTTTIRQVHLPAGMGFEVTDIEVWCGTVTSDPQISVGTTAAGTQIVAAVNLTTGANILTIKDGLVAAGGVIDVRIVADTGDAIAAGAQPPPSINIVGYVTLPPTSIPARG
jgi:hypothetical protein